MPDLQRLTTEYVEAEDRIRISGEVSTGGVAVFWLTQRLLNRLLPHLLGWLDRQGQAGEMGDLLQEFAQQAAMAAHAPEAPVVCQPESSPWLVMSVDITPSDAGMSLKFKSSEKGEGEAAGLTLDQGALRQWLNILLGQYRQAEWPMSVWPEWMNVADRAAPSRPPMTLH